MLKLDIQVGSHRRAELEAGLWHQHVAASFAKHGQYVEKGSRAAKGQNNIVHVNWMFCGAESNSNHRYIYIYIINYFYAIAILASRFPLEWV